MTKPFATLGEFEMQVLRLVWQHQPCTERQISDLVQQQRSVARTTVLKTMQRMEAKGLLSRVPGEGPIRFRAVQDERRLVPSLVGRHIGYYGGIDYGYGYVGTGYQGGYWNGDRFDYNRAANNINTNNVRAYNRTVTNTVVSNNITINNTTSRANSTAPEE